MCMVSAALVLLNVGCASTPVPGKTTGIEYSGVMIHSSKDKPLPSSVSGAENDSAMVGGAAVQLGAPLPVAVVATVLTHILGTSFSGGDYSIPSGVIRVGLYTDNCYSKMTRGETFACNSMSFVQPLTVEMASWKQGDELIFDKNENGVSFLRLLHSK